MALDWVDKIDNQDIVRAEDVNSIARAIRNNENSIEVLLSTKADKADTLEGYGITDSYTKQQTDAALLEKSDATNFKNGSGTGSLKSASATSADGIDSFAAGTGTMASGNASHVQGRYNVDDNNNIYAHIVGNGTSNNSRSNAHTVDWDGNGWFAGKVTVGESKDELITVDDALKKFCLHTTLSVQNSKSLTVTDGLSGTDFIDLKISGTQNGLGDFNSETEKYDVPITLRGKNLLDYTVGSTSQENCKGYSYSNGIWRGTGIKGAADRGWGGGQVNFLFTQNPIPTKGKAISISMYITRKSAYPITPSVNANSVLWFGNYNSNSAFKYSPCPLNERTLIRWSYTPNYNLNQLNFRLAGAEFEFEFNTLQIEYGNTVTAFEPYVTPQSVTLSLNEPLYEEDSVSLSDERETLTIFPVTTNIIEIGTAEIPHEISASYYQDINTVIANNYTELQAQIDAIAINN